MTGVQVVAVLYRDGTSELFHATDYYIFDGREVKKTNLLNPSQGKEVKYGKWALVDEYQGCIRKARYDVCNRWDKEQKGSQTDAENNEASRS